MNKLKLIACGSALIVFFPAIWIIGKLSGVGVNGLLGGAGSGGINDDTFDDLEYK
jgi:hypothetical protein